MSFCAEKGNEQKGAKKEQNFHEIENTDRVFFLLKMSSIFLLALHITPFGGERGRESFGVLRAFARART